MQIYNIIIYFLYNLIFNSQYILVNYAKRVYAILISFFINYHKNSICNEVNKIKNFPYTHKLPHHIAFLVIDEEPSYIDLSKLVIWSICLKIYKISFFDTKGSIKKNLDLLKSEIKICLNTLYDCNFTTLDVYYKILNDDSKIVHRNGHVNRIVVYIADSSDGYKMVNEICIKYSTNPIMETDKFDTSKFVAEMNSLYPEPNLAIKFGKIAYLAGFMPWHLRFTEIISLHSHRNISYHDFFTCLCQYAKCQQNFGT